MEQGNLWQFLSQSIDNATATFVTGISSTIASAIIPGVTAAVTIWIVMYGWSVVLGEVHEPLHQFTERAFKVSAILAVALGSGAYQSYVVDFVNGLTTGLAQTVMPGSTSNLFSVIDQLDSKGFQLMQMFWERGTNLLPWGGYGDLISALIVGISSAIAELVIAGLLLVVKVALALMLAVGPLFVACLAFGPTRRFAEGWIGTVANYCLLIFFLAATSAICLSIYQAFFDHMLATSASDSPLGDATSLLALVGALTILITQLPGIAAGIAGGAAVSGGAARAVGAVLGRIGGGGDGNEPPPKIESRRGGSISNANRTSSKLSGSGRSRVPAYQRATYERLLNGKN